MSARYRLTLLGEFKLHGDDRPIELPPGCQRVIALVALAEHPVDNRWVCSQLWPDVPGRRAIARLRSTMWRLRPLGADPVLRVDGGTISIAPEVDVDWRRAVELCKQVLGRPESGPADPALVAQLLPLLRAGELLNGWSDAWHVKERHRYQALRLAALGRLTRPDPAEETSRHRRSDGPRRCAP